MLITMQETIKQELVQDLDWNWEKNISELITNEKNLTWK